MIKFDEITVDDSAANCKNDHDKIYAYAVSAACYSFGNYWGSKEDDLYETFFSNGRILKVWNEYPKLRDTIFQNFVLSSWADRRVKEGAREDFKKSCNEIARQVVSAKDGDTSIEWAQTSDRLQSGGYDHSFFDELEILESMSDDQTTSTFGFWLERYIATIEEGDEEAFDKLYFSIKRAKGATAVREKILTSAMDNSALSEKIIKKISKSAPISLRRSIVQNFAAQKNRCRGIIESYNRGWRRHTAEDAEKAEKTMEKIESKLILFAAVDDYRLQSNLVDALDKDNLVWVVPAISAIDSRWLTEKLERRMS